MDKFSLLPIQSFAAQLLRGPRRLRLRQLSNIEFLLSLIEPGRQYPFEFVCHAITGYRGRGTEGEGDSTRLLDGELLLQDLVVLAEQLSDDADIPVTAWNGPLYAVDEVAARFDVSTKTIFRWRRRGLAGWKLRFADRRKRLLFTDSAIRRFVARNTALVTRGSSFSQLTQAERHQIVESARELVGEGHRTVNAVARQIAERTGRAVETIRLILKNHDEAHPHFGLFNRSVLSADADERHIAIWEAYVDGATLEALAARFDQTVPWMYRTITRLRARELKARKIEYVPSDEFTAADADAAILEAVPVEPLRQTLASGRRRAPADLPPYLAHLFTIPLLTAAGERHLFRKMNYLRFKADGLREGLDPESATARELDAIEALLEAAGRVKNEIVQANLRLVVSIAKRHVRPTQELFELVSDGNISLMRAVDKFDYSRGFKFSTYASWAIMRNFARSIPDQHQHHERYQTGWDEMLDNMATISPDEDEGDYLAALRAALERMLATLDEREQAILKQRYGLDRRGQSQTLEQIGQRLGVSKERIRQLESRAIGRLRSEFTSDVQQLLGT